MKAVMISIQPKWCEKIASGKKTLEIRKTMPRAALPFKCYIYCTLGKPKDPNELLEIHGGDGKIRKANGMVMGEFICDAILPIHVFENGAVQNYNHYALRDSCVDYDEIAEYIGNGNLGYAWHISGLEIYDEPKGVAEFYKPDKCPYNAECGCTYGYHCFRAGQLKRCGEKIERPPQSWCYVEEGI